MSAEEALSNVEKGVNIIGQIASGVDSALPYVTLIAGLFPGAASVIAALQIAAPIIKKIAVAAPVAVKALQQGEQIAAAIDKASPEMLGQFKQLYSIFSKVDPEVQSVEPEEVTDQKAYEIAFRGLVGRPWTTDEMNRWFERASQNQTNQW